ncbi:ParA family protein [Pacificispira sp.]|uniref:ParA family protein n=1 Tax=Pacificispira sp. TaxID=2888761 RepID=UPI003B521F11
MSLIIGVVSQKGGVGKSMIARLIAREYAAAGWGVKIADLDIQQGTNFSWQGRRLRNGIEPAIQVERFATADQALRIADYYDLLVLDGPPHATVGTVRIAAASDLLILPTGLALDDLEPTVLLAHELAKTGIQPDRLVIVFCRVGDSIAELREAIKYVKQAGYRCLSGFLPEKVGYRRAGDEGRAATETRYTSLNTKADELAQSVIDKLQELTKQRAA